MSCLWSQCSMMQPVNSQLNKSFQLDGELDIVLTTALSIPKNINNPPQVDKWHCGWNYALTFPCWTKLKFLLNWILSVTLTDIFFLWVLAMYFNFEFAIYLNFSSLTAIFKILIGTLVISPNNFNINHRTFKHFHVQLCKCFTFILFQFL